MIRYKIWLIILVPLLISFAFCGKKGEKEEVESAIQSTPSEQQLGPAQGKPEIQQIPDLPPPGGGFPTTFSKAPPSSSYGGPPGGSMLMETGSFFGPPLPYTSLGTAQILAKLLPDAIPDWELKEIEVGSQVFLMNPVVIVRGNYTEKRGEGKFVIYIMMTYQGEFSEATCELIMPTMKESKNVTIAGQKAFLTYSESNRVAKLLISPFKRIAIWIHWGEISSDKEVLKIAEKIDFKAVQEVSESLAPPIPQQMNR